MTQDMPSQLLRLATGRAAVTNGHSHGLNGKLIVEQTPARRLLPALPRCRAASAGHCIRTPVGIRLVMAIRPGSVGFDRKLMVNCAAAASQNGKGLFGSFLPPIIYLWRDESAGYSLLKTQTLN